MPEPGKKVLPSDEEIAEKTGKSVSDWFTLIESAGYSEKKHGEIVDWLMDEHNLQLFFANSIGHRWLLAKAEQGD